MKFDFLVPITYVELEFTSDSIQSDSFKATLPYYNENDNVSMSCCTNADAHPKSRFNWTRVDRNTQKELELLEATDAVQASGDTLCSFISLRAQRSNNRELFRCTVFNGMVEGAVSKSLTFDVQCEQFFWGCSLMAWIPTLVVAGVNWCTLCGNR